MVYFWHLFFRGLNIDCYFDRLLYLLVKKIIGLNHFLKAKITKVVIESKVERQL